MIKPDIRHIIRIILWGFMLPALILQSTDVAAETDAVQMKVTFRITLAEKKCQMAIWLANEQGDFIDTVYVTRKVAQKGLGNRSGELDDKWGGARLSVLPVWAHYRGIDYGGGNFYPPEDRPMVDAVSSATPKAGEFVRIWRPEKILTSGIYFYYIEINKSFDQNEHHDYSWYRGQPSVVWKGRLVVGDQISKGTAQIIGHGHVAGSDGKIYPDLSTLTTAADLIKQAEATFEP